MTNLLPYGIAWGVLAIVVIVLAFKRRAITEKEDDSVHLGGGGDAIVSEQVHIAKQLDAIDKWGKILTIVLVVTGLILGILYGMQAWEAGKRAGM
jgi:hypothetical protein